MKVTKTAEGGNYLKASFVKEHKITEVQIPDAREITEVTFEGRDGKPDTTKLQVPVMYNGQGKEDPSTWTLNNKSKNALVDAFGEDTDDWINKKIPITIGGQGDMTHILVDTLRIEK
jgi:hypothetical protein